MLLCILKWSNCGVSGSDCSYFHYLNEGCTEQKLKFPLHYIRNWFLDIAFDKLHKQSWDIARWTKRFWSIWRGFRIHKWSHLFDYCIIHKQFPSFAAKVALGISAIGSNCAHILLTSIESGLFPYRMCWDMHVNQNMTIRLCATKQGIILFMRTPHGIPINLYSATNKIYDFSCWQVYRFPMVMIE